MSEGGEAELAAKNGTAASGAAAVAASSMTSTSAVPANKSEEGRQELPTAASSSITTTIEATAVNESDHVLLARFEVAYEDAADDERAARKEEQGAAEDSVTGSSSADTGGDADYDDDASATASTNGGSGSSGGGIWEVLFTFVIPVMLEALVRLVGLTYHVVAVRLLPFLVACLPTTWLNTGDEKRNRNNGVVAHYLGLIMSENSRASSLLSLSSSSSSHHSSNDAAWPPPALVLLAALTIFALIVHPDGYTWIFLRKLRSGVYFAFESAYTCWDIIINDYGMILSTFLAAATFAALFFFAFVLKKTLSPRPNPAAGGKKASCKREHHHHHYHSDGSKHKKSRRRKGSHHPRGGHGGSRSGRLRGMNQQQQQPLQDANSGAATDALPALLEDRPVSPPLVIAAGPKEAVGTAGDDLHSSPGTSSNKTVQLPALPQPSGDRARTMSTESREDSTIASDDLSYAESVTGRSTPTMAPPSDKPSVVQASPASGTVSPNSGLSRANSCGSKGIKQQNRKQAAASSRRGKRGGPGGSAESSFGGGRSSNHRGAAGGGRNVSYPGNLSPPPTPSRWAALKPSNNSNTGSNRNYRHQRGNKAPSTSGNQPQHSRSAGNHQFSSRKSASRAGGSSSDATPTRMTASFSATRTKDSESQGHRSVVRQQHRNTVDTSQQSIGMGPVAGASMRDAKRAPRMPATSTSPRHDASTHLGTVPCPPGFGLQTGSQPNKTLEGDNVAFRAPARSFPGENQFGTPMLGGSPVGADQGSFFTSSWNDQPQSPSWADLSSSSAAGYGAASGVTGGTGITLPPLNSIGDPPGSTRSTCTTTTGGGFTLPLQHQASIESSATVSSIGESAFLQGLSLPPGASPSLRASKMPLNHVKDNPFVEDLNNREDDDQIEAELQELGGQMVGSILDF